MSNETGARMQGSKLTLSDHRRSPLAIQLGVRQLFEAPCRSELPQILMRGLTDVGRLDDLGRVNELEQCRFSETPEGPHAHMTRYNPMAGEMAARIIQDDRMGAHSGDGQANDPSPTGL
jgi:hypothetical protein